MNNLKTNKDKIAALQTMNAELFTERNKLYDDLKDFKLDYYATKYKLSRMEQINRDIKSNTKKVFKLESEAKVK